MYMYCLFLLNKITSPLKSLLPISGQYYLDNAMQSYVTLKSPIMSYLLPVFQPKKVSIIVIYGNEYRSTSLTTHKHVIL